MSRERLEELWARLLAGQELTPEEQRELVAGLDAQPALREILLDDAVLDGWLNGLGEAQTSGAAFAEKLRECRAAERDGPRFLKRVESRIAGRRRRGERRGNRPHLLLAALAAGVVVATGLFIAFAPPGRREDPARAQAARKDRLAAIDREREQLAQAEREAVARREEAAAEKARRAKEALEAERERIERDMREAVAKAQEGRPPAPKPPDPAPLSKPAPPPAPAPDVPKERTVTAAAKLTRLEGEAFLLTPDSRRAAKEGDDLLPAWGLETVGAASRAVIGFGDKTLVEVQPETVVRDLKAEGGKRLVVEKGALRAVVSRQPKDQPLVLATPHAEAKVLGTTLRILVDPDPKKGTRLDVEEGRVRLMRLGDQKTVEVLSGHFAVAATGVDLAATALPRTLHVGGASGKKAEDTYVYGFAGFENANFGALGVMKMAAGPQGACALLRFPNLVGSNPGQVPPKSAIHSATLKLHSLSTGPGAPMPIGVYRSLKPWNEGKGNNTPGQRGEATWLAAQKGSLPWEAPGARGRTDRSGDVAVLAAPVDGSGFVTVDVTAAVQAWAGGDANYGFVMDVGQNTGAEYSLSTSEDAAAGNRPLLTVTYTLK